MQRPIISILLPTRNRFDTIRRSLDSIFSQTLNDWELVISDNATDDAGKIAFLQDLAHGDPRIRLFVQDENIGIHRNAMFCIEKSRARYLIFLTDDDWWSEAHYLESLLAQHDGTLASVFPNLTTHNHYKNTVTECEMSPIYSNLSGCSAVCEALVRTQKGMMVLGLIDTQVFPKCEFCSVFDNDLDFQIEILGRLRISRKYPVRLVPSVTYNHPVHPGNHHRDFPNQKRDEDLGIVAFRMLEELRLAAAEDSSFTSALDIQKSYCIDYCRKISRRNSKLRKLVDSISVLRRFGRVRT